MRGTSNKNLKEIIMISRANLVTINEYPGQKITEVLGYVKGSTVQTKNVGKDIYIITSLN